MKTFKFLMPFLLVAFVLAGCDTDDLKNDIDELKNRVESLEAQVSAMNDNVNALKVFVDGNKTIKSYEPTTDGYKLVLSDGQELTLTQGKKGEVSTPEISISDDGNWVIDGVEQEGKKAVGNDAPVPTLSIKEETIDGEKGSYWYVDMKDGNGEVPVLGPDGKPVKATTSGNIQGGDEFFESVRVDGDKMVVKVKGYGKEYSLPIVEGLTCKIVTDGVDGFKDGVLTIGYGQSKELEVEISEATYMITAPAGWTAVLGDIAEGKATLTVTAPASASAASRATADNTKDLVLQVNKGVNWAIGKIQVQAETVISSYYSEYIAGKDLVIGKVGENTEYAFTLNKTTCPESMVQYIESDQEITEDGKVYFVKEGVTVTYNLKDEEDKADKITSLIVIGDNPSEMSTLKTKKIMSLNAQKSGKGFIMYNMILDASEHTNYVLNIDGEVDDVTFDYLYLVDKSRIILPTAGKNFAYINNKPKASVKTLAMCNTYVNTQTAGNPMITSYSNHEYKLENIVMYNNVFYSPQSDFGIEKFVVFSLPNTSCNVNNIYIVNNTFINLLGANTYGKSVIKGKLDVKNNLIWNDMSSTVNTTIFQAVKESDLSQVTADNYSNNKLYSKNNLKASIFHTSGNVPTGLSGNNLTNESSDPFTGGTFNWESGEFVPGPGYETVGAHIE